MEITGIFSKYQLPDGLWDRIKPLLHLPQPKKKEGRPRMDDPQAMSAIFYIFRNGCQWKVLPRRLEASSSAYDRFQEWRKAGAFKKMWESGLIEYYKVKGLDWEWQAMDGMMTKAPLGGEATGHNPTDRGRSGTKCILNTEGNCIPIVIAVDGANRHDIKMANSTLKTCAIEPPELTAEKTQNMYLDKGYDLDRVRDILAAWRYIPHIIARSEEAKQKKEIPGYRTRRWLSVRIHGSIALGDYLSAGRKRSKTI